MMPLRMVHDEHDWGVPLGGIGSANITEVPCKRGLPVALPGGPLHPQALSAATLDQTCSQAAGDHIEGPKDIDQIVTIQVAHDGAMPLGPRVVRSVGIIEKRASS